MSSVLKVFCWHVTTNESNVIADRKYVTANIEVHLLHIPALSVDTSGRWVRLGD